MTFPAPPIRRLIAAALAAFALTFAVLAVVNRGGVDDAAAPSAATDAVARADRDTDTRIRRLQAAVRATPRAPALQADLAAAYLQKARETGDPGFYSRADGLLRRARALAPRDPGVLAESGTLALARHDFRGALELARRARLAAPEGIGHFPVMVDALVELGRYGAAERTLQEMVDTKPDLAAYARVSYFRELHGDLAGAADAMRRAASAGGPVPENVAYVQTLLGDLELARGREPAARRAFTAALAALPGYVPAQAGQARLLAARGDLDGAIVRYRAIVERLPLPEHAIALGEAELAAGRSAAARRDLALVGAEQRLLAAAGVDTDAELAVYEADHGNARRGVALARRGWAAAPSVRSADALGWALTRAGRPEEGRRWARRALRLSSVDPLVRLHAGLTARATGHAGEARRHLESALRRGLAAHPWQAARARRALKGLG